MSASAAETDGEAGPKRKAQLREATARYRAKKKVEGGPPPPKKKPDRRIVGVDGEGEDFYLCKRCKIRCGARGGPCPKGGRHRLTYSCTACGERGVSAGQRCKEAVGGKLAHKLTPAADGHLYTYLCAVDEFGRVVSEAWNPEGLTHEQCAGMILAIPGGTLRFGFMFSYDVTKIIEDLPSDDRFRLMRPAARQAAVCKNKECGEIWPARATECSECGSAVRKVTVPLVYKKRGYDFFNGSITISAGTDGGRIKSSKIWDCFRFFGCAFVEALKNWSTGQPLPVATDAEIAAISAMKDKRGAFDQEDPDDVKRYCRSECHLLAKMMRRLIDAHEKAGIPLVRFDGAGSTASSLLRVNEVGEYKGPRLDELDDEYPGIARAIACAFSGGRFEDSVVGKLARPVYGFDISSAYPFALTPLPCLECGFWRREKRMTLSKLLAHQKKGNLAVCRYHVKEVSPAERKKIAWCPLPFRSDKGSITYGVNFSGWAWAPEVIAAMKGWADLVELEGEAWVYEKRCEHEPFAFLPQVYRKRLAWGKEGAGIVLKLGMNASYGKTAQSIGDNPPFRSWIWAGCCTATTRGQLLDAIASAKDRWNVLAVATDGVFALEDLPLKKSPWDTGTFDLPKPLGGWERKEISEGIFLAKPGLYYSLDQDGPGAFVRARGVGRREIRRDFEKLIAGFSSWDRKDMDFSVEVKSRRFYGAKSSIYGRSFCSKCVTSWPGVPEQCCPTCKRVGDSFRTEMIKTEDGREAYGTWDVRKVNIAFDPYPKREREGISRQGDFARLHIRDLGGEDSAPYDVGSRRTTPEGEAAREVGDFELEQPDWNG